MLDIIFNPWLDLVLSSGVVLFVLYIMFSNRKKPVESGVRSGTEAATSKSLSQAIDYLQKFQEFLGTSEAPMYIGLAKEKLKESWKYITEDDQEGKLTLSAVEGALRQQKWRDYEPRQAETLQNILQDYANGELPTQDDVLKRISMLRKQDIDIFPSAPVEAYGGDDETEPDVVS